jgi:hypothetical protein
MEERLCCFRAELRELKGYSHAPPLLVTVLEAVLLMLGTPFYLLCSSLLVKKVQILTPEELCARQ